MVTTYMPNERPLVRAYGAIETTRGTFKTPTHKYYADIRVNKTQPLAQDQPEYDGTFFGDLTAVRGAVEVSGTMAQKLSYEDLPMWLRLSVAGGSAGVTDGNATPGYTYAKRPHATVDNLDTLSLEYGYLGLPWECTELLLNDFTITGDIDDRMAAWQISGNLIGRSKDLKGEFRDFATSATSLTLTKTGAGWTVNAYQGGFLEIIDGLGVGQVRSILSNTATVITLDTAFDVTPDVTSEFSLSKPFTPAIPNRVRNTIAAPGTQLFLDYRAGFGVTQIRKRFISFSHTYNANLNLKRFMEDIDTMSTKVGHGKRKVSGQVRLEFNSMREYLHWKAFQPEKLRIYQPNGPIIDAIAGTKMGAWINVYVAYWDSLVEDERVNNVTVTAQYVGYVDATEGVPMEIGVKNALATLPA